MTKHTLVLNNDWTPLSILPISAMIWKDAVTDVLLNQVHPLHFYENWEIHSPSQSLLVPSVVVARGPFIHIKRFVSHRRETAFLRDNYTCQYCGAKDLALTADHVVPKSHRGTSALSNISAACRPCNHRKGDNASVRPKNLPYVPTYYELVKKFRARPITIPHASWIEYIGWDRKLIEIVEPLGMPGYLPLSA